VSIVVVAEKPSVARDIARVLGAHTRGDGTLSGNGYLVTWAIGHLVGLEEPDGIDAQWRRWSFDTLPMFPRRWPLRVFEKTAPQFAIVRRALTAPDVSHVICATDAGREGELIFRFIAEASGCRRPVKRLWISSLTDAAQGHTRRAHQPRDDLHGRRHHRRRLGRDHQPPGPLPRQLRRRRPGLLPAPLVHRAKELFGVEEMQPILAKTEWCVNKPENMIAMPLWGHTIKHYCTINKTGSYKLKNIKAPPFENIPQHNLGHNGGGSYRTEIDEVCRAMRGDAKQKGHEISGESMAKLLDTRAGDWRKKIKDRGIRRGGGASADGTHEAWRAASKSMSDGKAPAADWFLPFSMAADAEEDEVPPPSYDFDEKFSDWVDKLAQALKVK
jgi:hypothetical protein